MSTSHHGSPEEQAAEKRLLDQFLNRATPAFPDGPLNRQDQGELSFAIAHDPISRTVIIQFGKSVDWLGMDKKQALKLAEAITEHANALP